MASGSPKSLVDYHARRRVLWERDRGICGFCGEPVLFEEMDIDHRIPRAAGGTDTDDNLRCTHRKCNRSQPGKGRRGKPRNDGRAIQDAVTIAVRLPRALRDQMKAVAKDEFRSLNSQMVVALEWYVAHQPEKLERDNGNGGRPAPERGQEEGGNGE